MRGKVGMVRFAVIAVAAVLSSSARAEDHFVFQFPPNVSVLGEAEKAKLAKIGQQLAREFDADAKIRVRISGYTDTSGKPDVNEKLSWGRARAAADYLIERFKWDANRLTVEGRGPEDPIAPNDTAEDRARNRRVELEIVRRADALIHWHQNKVQYLPIGAEQWLPAVAKADLFRRYKASTFDRSHSGILFKDDSEFVMGPNSLIIIYGALNESREKLLEGKFNVELQAGELLGKLRRLGAGPPFAIKTPSAELELASPHYQVAVRPDNATLASICEGTAKVGAQGKTVEVAQGFGVRVDQDKEPEQPKKLPDSPTWLPVEPSTPLPGQPVRFSWAVSTQTAPAKFWLQLSTDAAFQGYLIDQEVSTTTHETTLPVGGVWLRVQALDASGLKGCFSGPLSVQIREPTPPPPPPPLPPPSPPPSPPPPAPKEAALFIQAGGGVVAGDLEADFLTLRAGLLWGGDRRQFGVSGSFLILPNKSGTRRAEEAGFSVLGEIRWLPGGSARRSFFFRLKAGAAGLPASAVGGSIAYPVGAAELGWRFPRDEHAWTLGLEALAGPRGGIGSLLVGVEFP